MSEIWSKTEVRSFDLAKS